MFRFMMIATLAFVMVSLPASAGADVEVTLASGLQSFESRIDSSEQALEKRFRKNSHYDRNTTTSSRRFAKTEYGVVQWATILLVPDVADYGMKNLVAALVSESLNRTGINPSGTTIRVHVDRLSVSKHSMARINGATTYVRGSFSLVDAANGEILRSAKISANLVIDPTLDVSYSGPDFAFEFTDASLRVGPALAYFVMKGLEELYEGNSFPHPVAVSYRR